MTASKECRTALDVFEIGVDDHPQGPAIFYFDTQLSKRALREDARALAKALQSRFQVRSGDRIAVMTQNIPGFVVALWAAWLVGAVVTPVNVMSRPRELLHQLNDSGSVLMICQESYFETVASILGDTPISNVVTVSELDYLDEVPATLKGSRRIDCPGAVSYRSVVEDVDGEPLVQPELRSSSPALIAYTSGTTGLPKGAVISHSSIVHNAYVWRDWYELDETDVVVAAAPLFHITGLMGSLVVSRVTGAPLILSYRFDAGTILELIERWRGT